MAILQQILELDELLSLSDSVVILVQPVGASKAFRSTVGAIRSGLARTNSPSFTGVVTVPTQTSTDISDRAASTSFVDSRSRVVFSEIKQIKNIVQSITENQIIVASNSYQSTGISVSITPVSASSILIIEVFANAVWNNNSAHWNTINLGWGGIPRKVISEYVGNNGNVESTYGKLILSPAHDGLLPTANRNYQLFLKSSNTGSTAFMNSTGSTAVGVSGLVITEVIL